MIKRRRKKGRGGFIFFPQFVSCNHIISLTYKIAKNREKAEKRRKKTKYLSSLQKISIGEKLKLEKVGGQKYALKFNIHVPLKFD